MLKEEKIQAVPSGEISHRKRGLKFHRLFTKPNVEPFDEVKWEHRSSQILDENGNIIFEHKNVEVPANWSQLATDIVASKYFRRAGVPIEGNRENSVRQLIGRVARTIREAGEKFTGYFANEEAAETFETELIFMLLNQYGAFNSPVWFNCGLYHHYGIKGSGGNWHWHSDRERITQAENNYEYPQCSACFIQSIDDDLMSIFGLVKDEARVFKYGSGTGTNFSHLRGHQENLSGGGTSSGLMSFLEVFDRAAGATKSGGTTRRAAKMVCLDMDHPEIVDFINWKANEEKKVAVLIDGGYSSDFNGEAYKTVSGQNSNNSVRCNDEFMSAYLHEENWHTTFRTTGEICETFSAKDLMRQIAQAAWQCADPGVQFDTTINEWHTCSNSDRINSSNPCSEFMFIDDTACNLASINLTKFLDRDGNFDIDGFKHASRIFTTAQEILVDLSSYPTKPIAQNSHDYRPLGLGYANLGALLMLTGKPYDSEEAYAICSAITAIMAGQAYGTSAELAAVKGAYEGFEENRESHMRVMKKHSDATYQIDRSACPPELLNSAQETWKMAIELGERFGYRNAQTTVLAPTGTIGLLMDCDTTGIEPDFALVKFKKLAGGGYFKMINQSVPKALEFLGYSDREIRKIVSYAQGSATLKGSPHINAKSLKRKGLTNSELNLIEEKLPTAFHISAVCNPGVIGSDAMKRLGFKPEQYENLDFVLLEELGFTPEQIESANNFICGMMTVENAPQLHPEHLPIFDCANRCGSHGTRFIAPMGHVRMMAAAQPFLSGAISKTINLENSATVDEIEKLYVEAWRLGLKAVAIYRDGSKRSQPLSSPKKSEKSQEVEKASEELRPIRRRLPDERESITHKFVVGGHKGYITVGLYEDGSPGEMFITMSKEGSTISGLMDTVATMASLAFQYGVPLESFVNKFSHVLFEPSGFTNNREIPMAKSIIDYVFRWLGIKFLGKNPTIENQPPQDITSYSPNKSDIDAPACHNCGALMVRNGTCYRCLNCGSTSGCS